MATSRTSEVSICNQALSWLGGNLITSLNDDSKEANLCLANYEPLRNTLLESREWTFAVARYSLSKLATDPIGIWNSAFQIPSEVLRVVSAFLVDDSHENEIEWVREGNTILCNYNSIAIRGIILIESPTKYPAHFSQALAARIAADIAIPLTNSRSLQADMFALYERKLKDAAAVEGMQGKAQRVRSPWLLRSR